MEKQNTSLDVLLTELAESDAPVRAALVYRLSDVIPDDMAVISQRWSEIPLERRRKLTSRLTETSETNFEVDFTDFALFALNDEDPEIRANAVAALWFNEEPRIMHRLISLLRSDDAGEVRAAAAEGLGRFVLAGELGDLPESVSRKAEEALLEALNADEEEITLQIRALESLSYSGRDEVPGLIMQAHEHPDIQMRASAIFAMGRSADERWTKHVVKALDAPEPQLRYEAARAAGELGLKSVVAKLIRMAHDSDHEIREAAIWSLGEIGGTEAQNALFRLAETETDEALLEVIEDAVNSAQLAAGQFGTILLDGDSSDFDLDDFDEYDLSDSDEA